MRRIPGQYPRRRRARRRRRGHAGHLVEERGEPLPADDRAGRVVRVADEDEPCARGDGVSHGGTYSQPNGGDFAAGWTVQGGGGTLQTEPTLSGVDQAVGPTVTYRLDGRLATTAPVDIQFKAAAFPSVAMRCVLAELSGKPYVKIDTNGNPSDGCN